MLSSLRGPLALFVSAVLLVASPAAAAFAANAGDQQYIDPFANGSANPAPARPAPKPRPAKPHRPRSPSTPTPSAGRSPAPSAGGGSTGSPRSAAGGSTSAPAASATTSPGGGAPGRTAARRHRGTAPIVQILGTGDAALLGVAERVPVVGRVLRAGDSA